VRASGGGGGGPANGQELPSCDTPGRASQAWGGGGGRGGWVWGGGDIQTGVIRANWGDGRLLRHKMQWRSKTSGRSFFFLWTPRCAPLRLFFVSIPCSTLNPAENIRAKLQIGLGMPPMEESFNGARTCLTRAFAERLWKSSKTPHVSQILALSVWMWQQAPQPSPGVNRYRGLPFSGTATSLAVSSGSGRQFLGRLGRGAASRCFLFC